MAQEGARRPSRCHGEQMWPLQSGCAGSVQALVPGWGALSAGGRCTWVVGVLASPALGCPPAAAPFLVSGRLAIPFITLPVGQA